MARQVGEVKITGTVDGIIFYKMDGAYYAREKSSLSRKRVLRDPVFAGTMRSAGQLGVASRMASRLYRRLSKEEKKYHKGLFNQLTGRAKRWLQEGRREAEAAALLEQYFDEVVYGRVVQVAGQRRKGTKKRLSKKVVPRWSRKGLIALVPCLPPIMRRGLPSIVLRE